MKHASLFSGIGGFDIAAEQMGWRNVFHCEYNPFGQRILKYYWPNAISYEDITKTDFTPHRGAIDILTGGFPCQPYSTAGKRLGKEDDRHLWPEMLRAIREIYPRWVVGENVRGLVNWNGGLVFDEVQADLEAEGYEVTPFLLPACAVNAPHRRDRIWFVAYSGGNGHQSRGFTEDRREEREGQGERLQRKWLWDDSRGNGKQRDITNPSNTGFKGLQSERENGVCESKFTSDTPIQGPQERIKTGRREDSAENRSGMDNRPERSCKLGHVTNTNTNSEQRCEGGMYKEGCQKTEGHLGTCNTWNRRRNWQDFPTQSPVCSRDDGLSSRLDGITFPKWRQESIKAYGNAVVPQVVYEIFKAIEKFEKSWT